MSAYLRMTWQRLLVLLFDFLAIPVAFLGAFFLRFELPIPPDEWARAVHALPVVVFVQALVFGFHGLYRNVWSSVGLRDLRVVFQAVAVSTILTIAVLFYTEDRLLGWPRSVFFLDAILLAMILGGGRFAYRFSREFQWIGRGERRRILMLGAGKMGTLFAREFVTRSELGARILGFLDDAEELQGLRIHGAPILGGLPDLEKYLDRLKPDEVVIAIPHLVGPKVKAVFKATQARKIACRICPPIRDTLMGKVSLSQLREVKPEDLLRRDVVEVDEQGLLGLLRGKSVLVTGAGGSIGTELCRQILRYEPKRLTLYERTEYNLYRIEQELNALKRDGHLETELKFVIGDVLDEKRLHQVFSANRPEIVLHAAAYKHVPMMEENIRESVQNNVLGTFRVASACAKSGAKTFVLVSTDKAVRPTSIMGSTKRMAELVVQGIGARVGMKTVAVRFGNVLDSEGSVLPLFRKQIMAGGPVTITHPEITRYFMTIPEAAILVLQAAEFGRGGELFLLDMGEPVLIRQLAEDLISLAGLRPGEDIPIVYTGLRKGEKLYEELLIDADRVADTKHPKIKMSKSEFESALPADWERELSAFAEAATIPGDAELVAWIGRWVPEYLTSRLGERASLEAAEESNPAAGR